MSDLDTIARRHAREVSDSIAGVGLPQLDIGRTASHPPRPIWAALVLIVMLLAFGLPFVFGSDHPELAEPMVATTVSTPEVTTSPETSNLIESGGGFVPSGPLSMSCAWCLGVLLDDGRVLVVHMSTWAEIYDPATWTFTLVEAGQTLRPPPDADAVLLADGRVLVVGLTGSDANPANVEIFDPASGKFRMIELPDGDATAAVRLTDGRVLLVGPGTAPVIFDPVTETFTDTSPASVLDHVEAALLDDGRVLVFGRGGETEFYDPATNSFTATGPMITPRTGFTHTKLADGRVLIVGGRHREGPELATAELYDPATGAFTQTGSLAHARADHAAALLPDGRVLVIGGGWELAEDTQSTAEIYDPVTGRFAEAPPLTTRRLASTAVPLADGTVLILGHYGGNFALNDGGSKSAEIFTLRPIDPPVGCCGENPTVMTITADVGTDPGRVSLVVPAGGLAGAMEASYHYAYGDSAGGVGHSGELQLPDDCAQGCVVPLPDAIGTVEVGYEGTVTVQLGYEGTAPEEAALISVSFEPG